MASGLDEGPVSTTGVDMGHLLELADRHNLLPAVAAAGGTPPPGWTASWTRASLLLATESARLCGALEQAGIRVMPLKGPVLAHMLHGSPAGRQYSDLDLMVEPGRAEAAVEILRGLGYEPKWTGEAAARHRRFNWYGELPLRHRRSGIEVDLHWTFAPRHYPARMDDAAVWSRAERVEFLGRAVEVPAPEDYFEYLCLHAARHEWSRLGWLADLAVFRIRFGNRIGLPELARRSEGGVMIAEGVRRTAGWLGEPAPPLSPRPLSALRRLRYLAAVTFIPTEADWSQTALPAGFGWLYYPLRLTRLIERGLRRLY